MELVCTGYCSSMQCCMVSPAGFRGPAGLCEIYYNDTIKFGWNEIKLNSLAKFLMMFTRVNNY